MMLLVFALMTAAAIFAVLWPLARARARLRAGNDLAVYRDQIEEIARDRDAGLIGAAEADAARVEVARRLLAADAAGAETEAAPGGGLSPPRDRRRVCWLRCRRSRRGSI